MDIWFTIKKWFSHIIDASQGASQAPSPPPTITLPEGNQPIRIQLCFYGRVQGVGFRYRAVTIARRLSLTGWVQNQFDGSVLLQAQGTPTQIDALVSALEKLPPIRIQHIDTQLLPLDQKERQFHEIQ